MRQIRQLQLIPVAYRDSLSYYLYFIFFLTKQTFSLSLSCLVRYCIFFLLRYVDAMPWLPLFIITLDCGGLMVDESQRIGSPGVTLTTLLMAAFACALGELRDSWWGGVHGYTCIAISEWPKCNHQPTRRCEWRLCQPEIVKGFLHVHTHQWQQNKWSNGEKKREK